MKPTARPGSGGYGLGLLLAGLAGIALAWLDSRPGWDDTGMTIGLLFVSSLFSGLLSYRTPWLVALLTGIWIPLVEFLPDLSLSSFFALVPAFAGAFAGSLISRAIRSNT